MAAISKDAPQATRERSSWPGHNPPASATTEELANIVLIERRILIRDCLTQCLRLSAEPNVVSFPSVEKWLEAADKVKASLVILCVAGQSKDPHTQREISLLASLEHKVPTILLSGAEDLDQIVDALDQGARGFIPTSISLDVAVEAMRLVKAGGVYVPASSVVAARHSATDTANPKRFCNGMFTARQAAVVEALRRGKANKIIAYELNMRESTVKVHVRSIMKKLNAKNRTEVGFIANGLLGNES
jgi:DNA-binding NarL/FixJ family response regulator